MRIVNIEDILPGKILYQVYGVSASRCKDAYIGAKIIVTSKPYICNNNNIESLRFKCIESYKTWDNNKGECHLNDRGLGKRVYNLNRLFHTKEDALDFIEQCKAGVFKDPKDQKYYDNDKQVISDVWFFDYEGFSV